MKRAGAAAVLLWALSPAAAQEPAPVLPESLRWFSPPGAAGVRGAWMLGAEGQPGAYVLRVELAAGARIPPHTHPDERHTTVLTGTLFVGFGDAFDPGAVVAVPAGAVLVTPAQMPHFVWARDADVVYQEAGVGPTRSEFLAPP